MMDVLQNQLANQSDEDLADIAGYYDQEPEHRTDLGNAKRLVQRHGQDFRYSTQIGWLVWNGTNWSQDDSGQMDRWAKDTVRQMYEEASSYADENLRKAIAEHALRSEARSKIEAMIALAKSEPTIPVSQDELDIDPWLLNVANGTLNLKAAELRLHARQDLITRIVRLPYDDTAECPTWTSFLDRIMDGDSEMIEFIQKAVGYSLTGSTKEQCFFILYGVGSNGKSTFLNTISAILGVYACQTRTETLMTKRGDSIPNDVARLAGARFVTAIETEGGRRLAEGLVKQLTGGDKMTARFLHHEFFEFQPTFKLWLACNHKPRIAGTDYAIWRRIRLIPFQAIITENERDLDFAEKLKDEYPGILAWAVDGCLKWLATGLTSPEDVKCATQAYRNESDVVAAFIDECCAIGADCNVPKGALYETYVEWAKKSGEQTVSKKELGNKLAEKGFVETRTKKERLWTGIGILEVTHEAGDER